MKRAIGGAVALSFLAIAVCRPALPNENPVVRDAPSPRTILFVGNSFIYYNNSLHNHLRRLTQSLDPANAKSYFFKSLTLSASYLSDHAEGAGHMIRDYRHKRKNGPWDVVVLQGHSAEPISKKRADKFKVAARTLDRMIREAGSRTAFFMTWAYKDKPEKSEPLSDAYTRIANELNALTVPVGLAFGLAQTDGPAFELYANDKRHPSMLGTYLAACVFYAALYGKSPVGAPYTAGLSGEAAKFAQTTAWKAVRNYFGR